jgi:hypothetical protein
MMSKRRVHDLIVGILVTFGAALAWWADPRWIALDGIVGVLLIQSGFTGFCPVYFLLDRMMGDAETPARASA